MDIDTLLSTELRVHRGGAVTWMVDEDIARFLYRTVSEGMSTLETGVGLSTVIFAMRGTEHIAITPQQEEVDRIKDFCRFHSISTDRLRFFVGFSEDLLPTLDLPQLDLVLIDGGHGFPVPYIDWRYTAGHLNVGGKMIIDDCQLDTGAVLRDFLRAEAAWAEEQNFFGRTSVFNLVQPCEFREWVYQPYVKARSRRLQYLYGLRKALPLIRRGDFSTLWSGLKRWMDAQT
jgi:hypothetical protein